MRFQARQILGVRREAASGRNDRSLRLRQVRYDLPLDSAKHILTRLRKNLADAPPRERLNHFIRIDKLEMQMLRQQSPDRRLPRPHEPNQGNVLDFACCAHE